jgi:hypothetical protein
MRTANGGNLVPEDGPAVSEARLIGVVKDEILDALRVEVNLTMIGVCQAID